MNGKFSANYEIFPDNDKKSFHQYATEKAKLVKKRCNQGVT